MKTSVFRSQIKFAWSGRRNHLLGWLLVPFMAVCFLAADFKLDNVVNFWANNIDPYFSVAVLIVAITLWFGDFHQDWRQSLPCLLTVVFVFKGREVMRCENAALASEADMRALGQTIGSQMIDNKTMTFFAPKVTQSGGNVIEIEGAGLHRHYNLEIVLRDLPAKIQDFGENEILVWRPDFVNEPTRELRD